MAADLDQLLHQGDTYARNAKDALDRDVKSEEQLYVWDNQIEVLDGYLADTEDLAEDHADLADTRETLRDLKRDLERKMMAFLAAEAGEEPVDEDLADEEWAEMFVAASADLLEVVDESLDDDVDDVEELDRWEGPLASVKSFLADSEPYEHADPELPKVREQLKERKLLLEERIDSIVTQWREQDLAKGS